MNGFVSFVGAGPGDIGLITEKGIRCIERADVILYDRLVNPRLLRYANDNCEFIYCGKLPNRHVMRQEMINAALVEYALKGLRVVRLKGGDPSVFGRVGEEAEAVKEANIKYEIVPGVTSSIAAASYAGFPVTHREYSTSFTVRTGHYCNNNANYNREKDEHGDTIAYYMGVKNLPHHCEHLMKEGLSPETKVAVIEWATTGKQRTVVGTLSTISNIVKDKNIQNPAMTLIGDVVSLREKLSWFEENSLFGKRILIAKASSEDSELEKYLLELGSEAYAFPTLKKEIVPLSVNDIEKVLKAEKLLITVPESVDILIESLFEYGYDVRHLPKIIGCFTEKTLRALQSSGIRGTLVTELEEGMVVVGSQYGKRSPHHPVSIETHRLVRDVRFTEVETRLIEEDHWETVIFPNRASVHTFVKEAKALGLPLETLKFAYIGKSVKAYAEQHGFIEVDSEVQVELNKWLDNNHKLLPLKEKQKKQNPSVLQLSK